ncbi:MAG: D-glucuronyl C5-epimerase family protein [candidate division Zixibacteria bacterium]|nr:D-glucuronyl C5-epimerase family protein [candidate division Zixibacteria bacterium]
MAALKEKFFNLVQYFGVRSPSYYHAQTPANYDPADFMAYYIDESGRADYAGPHDAEGIPMYVHKGKAWHFPILICLCALAHLEMYRRGEDDADREFFLKIAHWLVANQQDNGLWMNLPPTPKFGLPDAWPSALMQGLGISCLTRAHRLTGSLEFVDRARMALKPYRARLEKGGVASVTDGRVFYEEYPSVPTHHVLNGFIFAMWGLHDMVRLINDDEAARLFDDGLETIAEWLPKYDTGYWSLYHIGQGRQNPASIHYHRLHIEQLRVMHAITGMDIFEKYHTRWTEYLNGRFNALQTLPKKIWWNLTRGF